MDDKLRKLVDRLLKKTQAGELRWSETSSPESFQTSFPDYSIEVEKNKDLVLLRIYNSDGRIIESVVEKVSSFRDDAEALSELHDAARRQALGVEKALDDILASLG